MNLEEFKNKLTAEFNDLMEEVKSGNFTAKRGRRIKSDHDNKMGILTLLDFVKSDETSYAAGNYSDFFFLKEVKAVAEKENVPVNVDGSKISFGITPSA